MARRGDTGRARPQSSGLRALHDRFVGDDPERVASYERALADAQVAEAIHALRTGAGLSQRDLAARVGTSASVICRLEDADYQGHSLSLLRRVAEALGHRVLLRFTPIEGPPAPGEARKARQTRPAKPAELSDRAPP